MKVALFALLAVEAMAAAITYTYDAAGRITGVDYGNGSTITYTYDSNGNLLARTATARASQLQQKDDSARDDEALNRNNAWRITETDVTASFQIRLPPNSPVQNITFRFGGPGVIGHIDLNGQFVNGSFLTGNVRAHAGTIVSIRGVESSRSNYGASDRRAPVFSEQLP
jgi:YD repeat-containing protein